MCELGLIISHYIPKDIYFFQSSFELSLKRKLGQNDSLDLIQIYFCQVLFFCVMWKWKKKNHTEKIHATVKKNTKWFKSRCIIDS